MLKHVHDLRNDLREKGWLKRDFRGFPNHISEEWKLRCSIGIEVWVMKFFLNKKIEHLLDCKFLKLIWYFNQILVWISYIQRLDGTCCTSFLTVPSSISIPCFKKIDSHFSSGVELRKQMSIVPDKGVLCMRFIWRFNMKEIYFLIAKR